MSDILKSFSLAGRVALVTGGAGHLGSAICRGLAQAGAHVLINGRNEKKLQELAAALRRDGYDAEPRPFDITDHASMQRSVGDLAQLDIIVNNAISVQTGNVGNTPAAAFEPVSATGATAAYALVQAALPLLRQQRRGSVINIASMYAVVSPDPRIYGDSGYDNPPQYGVAKAGLLQLTRYLACHLAPDGIRVNAVSPGPFPPAEQLRAKQPGFLQRLEDKVPMRRVGRPDELSGVIVFLASDAASYITGANIAVDGGWTAW